MAKGLRNIIFSLEEQTKRDKAEIFNIENKLKKFPSSETLKARLKGITQRLDQNSKNLGLYYKQAINLEKKTNRYKEQLQRKLDILEGKVDDKDKPNLKELLGLRKITVAGIIKKAVHDYKEHLLEDRPIKRNRRGQFESQFSPTRRANKKLLKLLQTTEDYSYNISDVSYELESSTKTLSKLADKLTGRREQRRLKEKRWLERWADSLKNKVGGFNFSFKGLSKGIAGVATTIGAFSKQLVKFTPKLLKAGLKFTPAIAGAGLVADAWEDKGVGGHLQRGIGGAMAGGQIGFMVGGPAGAAVGAVIGGAMAAFGPELTEALKGSVPYIQKGMEKAAQMLSKGINWAAEKFGAVWNGLKTGAKWLDDHGVFDIYKKEFEMFKTGLGKLTEWGSTALTWIGSVVRWVSSKVPRVARKAYKVAKTAGAATVSGVKTAYSGTRKGLAGARKWVDTGVGSLSAMFESSKDSGTVSGGKGDAGGKSYGTYQIATKNGSMSKFLSWLSSHDKDSYSKLADAGGATAAQAGDPTFIATWKSLAKNPKFEELQHQYIKETHFDPVAASAAKYGLNANRSRAITEMVWSMGVQHGPKGAARIIARALEGKDASTMSDVDVIKAVYAERSDVDKYFKSSSEAVKQGVANRFATEEAILTKAASANEKPTPKVTSPVNVANTTGPRQTLVDRVPDYTVMAKPIKPKQTSGAGQSEQVGTNNISSIPIINQDIQMALINGRLA